MIGEIFAYLRARRGLVLAAAIAAAIVVAAAVLLTRTRAPFTYTLY